MIATRARARSISPETYSTAVLELRDALADEARVLPGPTDRRFPYFTVEFAGGELDGFAYYVAHLNLDVPCRDQPAHFFPRDFAVHKAGRSTYVPGLALDRALEHVQLFVRLLDGACSPVAT